MYVGWGQRHIARWPPPVTWAEVTPGPACEAVHKGVAPYCVHLPILNIGVVSAVADGKIVLLPLDLEGVVGPDTDINGEGRSLKGYGHVAKAKDVAVDGPPVVRDVAVG